MSRGGCCGPPSPDPRGSEITAGRHDDLVGRLRAAGLAAIADLSFVGLGFVGLDSGGDDSSDLPVITSSVARKTAKSTGKSRPKHPPDPSDPLRAG
ncbi:hypothetical protein OHB25_11620 [Streptomyces mirabilis]|uniref:hypothetical protein n=1 Tax=Streptomyces TaxID=1883 RepID=UPI0019673E22|nr:MULTISPECIES: hypothetical protein [Streptomyces]MCX4614351.1 hypothetical protein [Streptomyces mirabilis]MCX5354463.1 hypothetical protein [Streptomyces mirabilis]